MAESVGYEDDYVAVGLGLGGDCKQDEKNEIDRDARQLGGFKHGVEKLT
jgi:hypothetical protein